LSHLTSRETVGEKAGPRQRFPTAHTRTAKFFSYYTGPGSKGTQALLVLYSVNSKQKGNLAETAIAFALVKKGYTISIPWGENSPYDIIADDGQKLIRVQCKLGRVRKGSVHVSIGRCFYSKETKTCTRRPSASSKFDVFGVYCPELNQCFIVPVGSQKTEICLRLQPVPPHVKRVLWAKDFELEGWSSGNDAGLLNRGHGNACGSSILPPSATLIS
jgi:hypothetical protein